MPTYGYRCETNGHEFEIVQGINEPALTECQVCGERVTRIFYPVGIVFKGPGFYKTDSRGGSSGSTLPPGSSEKTSETPASQDSPGSSAKSSESGAGGGDKADAKVEAKPAAKKSETKDPKPAPSGRDNKPS